MTSSQGRTRITTDRSDGRHVTTAGWVHAQLKADRPLLAFDSDMSAAALPGWRAKVRRKLRELLALPAGRSSQPQPVRLSDEAREGYRLQRWELYPEAGAVVPMMLLVPDGLTRRRRAPAVICLPGSDTPMEVLAGEPAPPGAAPNRFPVENAMALELVREGLVCLIIENPGTASMADPRVEDWRRQSWELVWMGRSYEGVSVLHKLEALRWLRRLTFVDPARVAACGHSLGAKPALLLGVLDQKLAAVVWNSGAYDWRQRHVVRNLRPVAPWHYIPGFARWFDYLDLKAALAPTPLMASEGGHPMELAKVRRAYALAGAPDEFVLSWVPSYRDPARRAHENEPIPEGLDEDDYLARLSATNAEHYYHGDVVTPWLVSHLKPRA